METTQTVKSHHHTRWAIGAYREGWNEAERMIQRDFSYVDYPTALAYAQDQITVANNQLPQYGNWFRSLGMAARWLAAVN